MRPLVLIQIIFVILKLLLYDMIASRFSEFIGQLLDTGTSIFIVNVYDINENFCSLYMWWRFTSPSFMPWHCFIHFQKKKKKKDVCRTDFNLQITFTYKIGNNDLYESPKPTLHTQKEMPGHLLNFSSSIMFIAVIYWSYKKNEILYIHL